MGCARRRSAYSRHQPMPSPRHTHPRCWLWQWPPALVPAPVGHGGEGRWGGMEGYTRLGRAARRMWLRGTHRPSMARDPCEPRAESRTDMGRAARPHQHEGGRCGRHEADAAPILCESAWVGPRRCWRRRAPCSTTDSYPSCSVREAMVPRNCHSAPPLTSNRRSPLLSHHHLPSLSREVAARRPCSNASTNHRVQNGRRLLVMGVMTW